jgi:hypothetical protein
MPEDNSSHWTQGGITHHDDIDKAMLAVDAHIGQNPDQADPIQSKRCGRKSRQAKLKQKARHIMTWSMAESFKYFTSKSSSVEEDADILWY